MTIGIPVHEGRLHEHFGGCRQFALVQIEPTTRTSLCSALVPAPDHQPGLFPRWLREHGVEVVLAGGIGRRALALFAQHGIAVHAAQPGTPVDTLVTTYLQGQLSGPPEPCAEHDHHGHQDHGHSGPHGSETQPPPHEPPTHRPR